MWSMPEPSPTHRRSGLGSIPSVAETANEPAWDRPTPRPIQVEALAAVEATRAAGFRSGLVVMATGLGKTWLAAFDSAAT